LIQSYFSMSNFKFSKSHNPELDAARIQHDSLPKTEYGKGKRLSKEKLEQDKKKSYEKSYRLGQLLYSAVQEHYSYLEQAKFLDSLIKVITHLGDNARIFPDMDYDDIWYTDYYDLIELAKDMGLGDYTLPHWPEESNPFHRYLELTTSDLVQITLIFVKETVID